MRTRPHYRIPPTVVLLLTGLVAGCHLALAQPLQDAAHTVAEGLKAGTVQVSGYKRSLAHEGVLRWAAATEQRDWIDWGLQQEQDRSVRPREPFNCPEWWLSEVSGDDHWRAGLLAENLLYHEQVSRSREGAIEHPKGRQRGGGQALLIDALQDYVFRMAVTAQLSGEFAYAVEAVQQYRLYRDLLRDPETGLWSQGRGWLSEPDALSPGFWSRGQGWLIRGMVDTLLLLPPESAPAAEMRAYLRELADALLRFQQPDGMWHCLLNRGPGESPPEVSGSALIAGNLGLALAHGMLAGEEYAAAARRTFAALPAYVEADGTVRSVSPGPGPLETEAPWQVHAFPPGDEHGPFAILFAALGQWELQHSVAE